MTGDQMGTGPTNPTPREMPLSNQTRFSSKWREGSSSGCRLKRNPLEPARIGFVPGLRDGSPGTFWLTEPRLPRRGSFRDRTRIRVNPVTEPLRKRAARGRSGLSFGRDYNRATGIKFAIGPVASLKIRVGAGVLVTPPPQAKATSFRA